MRNPLRSEADAFRLVWQSLVALALIALGAWINKWLGIAVLVIELAVLGWLVLRRGRPEQPVAEAPPPSPPGEHRILVIANETVGGPELLGAIREHAGDERVRLLVVAPVPVSPAGQWTGDDANARRVAQQRLTASVESMRASGLDVSGEIGDADPVQAAEDALRTFAPDEVIVSTHPPGRSHWLENDVVQRMGERFAMPLTHVVVDLDADRSRR